MLLSLAKMLKIRERYRSDLRSSRVHLFANSRCSQFHSKSFRRSRKLAWVARFRSKTKNAIGDGIPFVLRHQTTQCRFAMRAFGCLAAFFCRLRAAAH